MAKKLYVGNLAYSVTKEQLNELFSQVGSVADIALITDHDGRPKGFGFVEMSSEEEAQEAIKRFNGQVFNDRTLTVNEARPREERPKSNFGGGGGRRDYQSGGRRNR
ncbi:MAG: RNA-binding protein [Anaerolineae bacterium]|nr:RNA-binding protein [Anaerolineae bacterium]